MFRLKPIVQGVLLACGGLGLAALSAPTLAQQTQQQKAEQKLERVTITGSNIRRIEGEAPAPVQIITREQIERSGAQSISDLLRNIPANNTGTFNESAIGSFTPGAAGVSLRGLGAQATLVLMNGRRISSFGFATGGQSTFVDVNQIPLSAVERIEVLLDGASAIYGSEAMAGVINVITRKDYRGAEVRANYGIPDTNDTSVTRLGATFGYGDRGSDKFNVFVNFEHYEQEALLAKNREYTRTRDLRRFGFGDNRSSYHPVGNFFNLANTAPIGPRPGCAPLNDPTSPFNGLCAYDFYQDQELFPEASRTSLFGAVTVDLTSSLELFADAALTKNNTLFRSFGYGTNVFLLPGCIILPATNPQNPGFGTPGATDVCLRYRFNEVRNQNGIETKTQRYTLGLRGGVAGWDLEGAFVSSQSKSETVYQGYPRDSELDARIVNLTTRVARPGYVFGNPGANSPAVLDAVFPKLKGEGKSSTNSFDLRGSRELFTLPAGAVSVALGADYRKERLKNRPDKLIADGEIGTLGGTSTDGSRNVRAFYGELSVPILKTLEAQLAARQDRYSDFGGKTTPKVGLKYRPVQQLMLRATYSEGFRAPALTELVRSPIQGFFDGVIDPLLCPDPTVTGNPNCSVSLPATIAANPDLKPETSKGKTIGLVFEPVRDWTFTADYFDITRDDEITYLRPSFLLANEALYPGKVIRNADQTLNSLILEFTNIATTRVRGYDLEVRGRIAAAEFGTFRPAVAYGRTPLYEARLNPLAPKLNFAGTQDQPTERARISVDWDKGVWALTGTVNYIGGYSYVGNPTQQCSSFLGATTRAAGRCQIPSWATLDLFARYRGVRNLDLTVAVQNVEDVNPPFDANYGSQLYNPGYTNALGRFITVGARYVFN